MKNQDNIVNPQKSVAQMSNKLEIEMSNTDFDNLFKAAQNESIKEFITGYQKVHPTLTEGQVLALSLIKTITNTDKEVNQLFQLPGKLLKFQKEGNNDNKIEPLITLDKNGNTVILYSLKHLIGLESLISHVQSLNKDNEILKIGMDKDLTLKLADAVSHPEFVAHPVVIIKELIEPLYTEESTEALKDLIGRDWLDNYYL